MALTLARRLLATEGPPDASHLFLSVFEGSTAIGAALCTPPWPLLVTGLPSSAVRPVLAFLQKNRIPLGGVTGPLGLADTFAEAFQETTGGSVRVAQELLLYRLAALEVPQVPGVFRLATEADVAELAGLREAFLAEALDGRDARDQRDAVRHLLALGNAQGLWTCDGATVAHAAASSPLHGMSRIGPVYTPPARRRRGYGAAVTHGAVGDRSRRRGGASLHRSSEPHVELHLSKDRLRPGGGARQYTFRTRASRPPRRPA